MLDDHTKDAVTACALRFDGWRWLESLPSRPANDFAAFTIPYVETLVPHASPAENYATFFALQRWLHKWGGEAGGDTADQWLAYWQLFLILWASPTPDGFVYHEYESKWRAALGSDQSISQKVRDHVVSEFGGSRSRFRDPYWLKLNKLQVGRFAEHLAKLEFAKANAQIFASDVDDRGIDFLAILPNKVLCPVQVKSVRSYQPIYLAKASFEKLFNVKIAVIDFTQNREPEMYLVPLDAWQNPPSGLESRLSSWTDKSGVAWWVLHVDKKSIPLLRQHYSLANAGLATE